MESDCNPDSCTKDSFEASAYIEKNEHDVFRARFNVKCTQCGRRFDFKQGSVEIMDGFKELIVIMTPPEMPEQVENVENKDEIAIPYKKRDDITDVPYTEVD